MTGHTRKATISGRLSIRLLVLAPRPEHRHHDPLSATRWMVSGMPNRRGQFPDLGPQSRQGSISSAEWYVGEQLQEGSGSDSNGAVLDEEIHSERSKDTFWWKREDSHGTRPANTLAVWDETTEAVIEDRDPGVHLGNGFQISLPGHLRLPPTKTWMCPRHRPGVAFDDNVCGRPE
jgi:hypothetical protein